VSRPRQAKQADVVAHRSRSPTIAFAQLEGHVLILLPVDEDLRNLQREQLDRGCSSVPVGVLVRATLEEQYNCTVAELQFEGSTQIGHRCQRHHTGEWDRLR
jgi:hypothetical protein